MADLGNSVVRKVCICSAQMCGIHHNGRATVYVFKLANIVSS